MGKKKKETDDIEVLAIWIGQSALMDGKFDELRKMVQTAAIDAMEHYSNGRENEIDDPYDPDGVRRLLARFGSELDALKIAHEEDK